LSLQGEEKEKDFVERKKKEKKKKCQYQASAPYLRHREDQRAKNLHTEGFSPPEKQERIYNQNAKRGDKREDTLESRSSAKILGRKTLKSNHES